KTASRSLAMRCSYAQPCGKGNLPAWAAPRMRIYRLECTDQPSKLYMEETDPGASMAEEQPSLHIDTDWKKQAQEEKRRLAEDEQKRAAASKPAASAAPAATAAPGGAAAATATAGAPTGPRARTGT